MRLNLLCSRLDELKPGLSGFLAGLEDALLPSGQALAEFCSAFNPALETARVAHGARIEAAQAQVYTSQTTANHAIKLLKSAWSMDHA